MELGEKTTLSQIVSERIKQYIVDHQLEPGAKLPSEKQLTEMLQVSRTVVRESLKTLEILGIIRIKAGGGVFVDAPSLKPVMDQVSFLWKNNAEKIDELLATRKILELGAVEMAIQHGDMRLIEQMEVWNEKMEHTVKKGELPVEEDLEFHRALFRATGNQTYFELSDVLSEFFHQIRELHFGDSSNILISIQEHKQLIEYIRGKDIEAAKTVMLTHLTPLQRLTMTKSTGEESS